MNSPNHTCNQKLFGDHFMILAKNIFRNKGFMVMMFIMTVNIMSG